MVLSSRDSSLSHHNMIDIHKLDMNVIFLPPDINLSRFERKHI